MMRVDVVIPAHKKDEVVLRHAVRAALRHLDPIDRVLVVSRDRFDLPGDRVVWVPEPDISTRSSLESIRQRWQEANPSLASRAPWIYQQLLKLGAGTYIDDLSEAFLVIDSDVIFLRPVSWETASNQRFPYSLAYEYNDQYRAAYVRLFGREPSASHSLTAHHMLYDQGLLRAMWAEMEERHGVPWHEAYVGAVDFGEVSSISEMDIYGWWVLDRHPELAYRRQLIWQDSSVVPRTLGRAILAADFDFVAAHAWKRQSRTDRIGATARRVAAELSAGLTWRFRRRTRT